MWRRRTVQVGLVLSCTTLLLAAASLQIESGRDALAAKSATGVMAFSAPAYQSSGPQKWIAKTPVSPAATATGPRAPVAKPQAVVTANRGLANKEGRQGGDTCATATMISALPYSVSGTTCGYTNDYDEACPYDGTTSPDVVYQYTPGPDVSCIDITLCTGPTNYDSKVYIYEDTCPGTVVACNDDACASPASPIAWVPRLWAVPLTLGHTYYIVVDGYAGGCGDYYMDITPCVPPPECPPESMFSQPTALPDEYWIAYTSAITSGSTFTCYEDFSSLSAPIGGVHWWGLSLYLDPNEGWLPCDPNGVTFQIKFYQDADGRPGAPVSTYTVMPTIVDTGFIYGGIGELYYYSVDNLSPCTFLTTGWISIQSQSNPADCAFLWMNSPTGDQLAYQNQVNLGNDLALCLTAAECAPASGACCLDSTSACSDNMDGTQCMQLGGRFVPDTLCTDLDPPCGQLPGACCHPDGTCDIVPELACPDSWLGAYTNCNMCPCIVPCPPGAGQEPEACGADTDGGCNMSMPTFAPINCGDVICGTVWADTTSRDTDWYQITTTDFNLFTWTAEAEQPVTIYIIQGAGPNDCSSSGMLVSATADACTPASASYCAGPGTYWFWVGPSALQNWPCPIDYAVSLTCEPCESGYCQAGASYCDEYISRVQIDGIDNATPCTLYGDYTALGPAALPFGVGTQLTVTNGYPVYTADTCTVWIDWNHDGVFNDRNEENLGDIPGVGPYVFNIVPPNDTLFGPTRMRIRIDYNDVNPYPCGFADFGEVEDYTVNVPEVEGACCDSASGQCSTALPSQCNGAWGGPFTACALADCNENGIDDFCDILDAHSEDCNSNGVPDECEQPWQDCNHNGIMDECDILSGHSRDCNENGIPDECDVDPTDPDGNGEVSDDCQPDGIPDECQVEPGAIEQWDDGTSESSIGLTAGGEFAWVQQFTATGHVSRIQTCFGTPASPGLSGATPGATFHVYIWNDPNQDGNPLGAVLLASADGSIDARSIDSDVLQEVAISADVTGSFFVGASYHHAQGTTPGPLDETVSQGHAWFTFNGPVYDPNTWDPTKTYQMDAIGLPGNWLLRAVIGGGPDCNTNGIPDECDIAVGTSGDCNTNGTPDECEIANCDGSLWCQDCNSNGLPDECDLASGFSQDCNRNDIPDECDIATGGSCDCQGDLVPDECQVGSAYPILQIDDGTSEIRWGLTPGGELCWMNHVVTPPGPHIVCSVLACFGSAMFPGSSGVTPGMSFRVYVWSNPNQDGNPRHGVFLGEATGTVDADSIDTDVPQPVALSPSIPLTGSFFIGASVNHPAGGYPAPADNDGQTLVDQAFLTFNSVPFDPNNFTNLLRVSQLGAPHAVFILRAEIDCTGPTLDCNGNGIPDQCDIGTQWGGHCEGQGGCWPVDCSSDWNGNGVPDECEEVRGDLNCDGSVNFGDINPFVLYLSNFSAWQTTYAGCNPLNGDINGDGNYPSFGDINPFVALLTGG